MPSKNTELEASVGLRVAGLFVILVVSAVGALIPLQTTSRSTSDDLGKSPFFLVMRMFGAGIMLGVAFMHLLADANEDLTTVCPEYPALSMVLATAGCILVLCVEQAAHYFLGKYSSSLSGVALTDKESHTSAGDLTSTPAIKDGEYHGGHDCTCKPLVGNGPSSYNCDEGHTQDHDHEHAVDVEPGLPLQVLGHSLTCQSVGGSALKPAYDHEHDHGHSHAHTLSLVDDGDAIDAKRLMIKAFIMEIAIATHSIIIGVAFGALGDGSLDTIRALFAALSFHQFFEGIALGTAIAPVKNVLGWCKVRTLVCVFALTTPIGIVIGMLSVPSDEEPSNNQAFAQGVLNAIAAGNLIYIALVEMVAESMSAPFLAKNSTLKALMFAALVLGDLCMAILAIWA